MRQIVCTGAARIGGSLASAAGSGLLELAPWGRRVEVWVYCSRSQGVGGVQESSAGPDPAAAGASPGRARLLPVAAGVVSAGVYLATLRPTVASPRDAAELALAAITLGIPHPTGYPLYMLLGHGWVELFAFGDPGWRLNVFSALCTGGAIALLARLLLRIVHRPGVGPAQMEKRS